MYNVDGFLFEDEETAELAKKEQEGIRYLRERTDFGNLEVVLKLYKKLLEQKIFVTPVGVRFLLELQDILLKGGSIPKEEIPLLSVSEIVLKKEVQENTDVPKKQKTNAKTKQKDYKKRFHIATFFAVIFALSVVGMFIIAKLSGNNVNIINYRNEILNEYSTWEAQLQEKEAQLKELERNLENNGK